MSDLELKLDDENDRSLPDDLVSAIDRARQQMASRDSVESVKATVLKLTTMQQPLPVRTKSLVRKNVNWILAAAASMGLLASLRFWHMPTDHHPPFGTIELTIQPSYSPVISVELTQVGYQRIVEDLDRADAQIEAASEGLQLAAVRYEIQTTLEEFYDWSK
jgi:hypothetical protein